MYIQPDSEVRLLTNVPLDNTYAHTIYFASKQAQTTYFQSKTKAGCIFNNVSYQRHTRGSIRLLKLADNIYDCNYMMFKNTAFGDRWFYAFIREVEYISNTVCEVTYEIDVMQTWFFDVTLLQSFVEREHSATDVAGDNILPEPVTLGEEFMGVPRNTELFYDYDVVIVSPYQINLDEDEWQPYKANTNTWLQETPTSLCYEAINMHVTFSTAKDGYISPLQYYLSIFPDIDDIACVYLVPHALIDFTDGGGHVWNHMSINEYAQHSIISHEEEVVFFDSKPISLCHGYVPKNKKLLTAPYNKIVIDTNDGNTYDYAFEFFSTDNIRFKIKTNLNVNASFKAVPINYKGETENFTEGCLLTDFPVMSLAVDSFKAWWAQNKSRVGLQVASDVLGVGNGLGSVMAGSLIKTPVTKVLSKTGAKMMAGGLEDVGRSGVRGIGEVLTELADRSRLRYHPKAGSLDGSLELAHGKKDFVAIQYSVNPQNALIIDDFFNCYGYATHRVKVPNRNVRPHWTFVKTIDINVESNAPADDTNKICSIYDNGITFWKNPSEVGNYSLDNSPVSS